MPAKGSVIKCLVMGAALEVNPLGGSLSDSLGDFGEGSLSG